jgi:hypothetical protein
MMLVSDSRWNPTLKKFMDEEWCDFKMLGSDPRWNPTLKIFMDEELCP